eukprot:jgi/Ulvmu1/9025/UM005_0116.1
MALHQHRCLGHHRVLADDTDRCTAGKQHAAAKTSNGSGGPRTICKQPAITLSVDHAAVVEGPLNDGDENAQLNVNAELVVAFDQARLADHHCFQQALSSATAYKSVWPWLQPARIVRNCVRTGLAHCKLLRWHGLL